MAGGSTAKGSSTRTRILAEARAALVARGIQGLVLREIAASCDIKLGNLQYYFRTTEDLALAVMAAEAEDDRTAMRERFDAAADPEAALRDLLRELVTRWRGESAAIYATLNVLSLHHEPYRALYQDNYLRHYALLEAAIEAARPGLAAADYAERARLATALVDGSPFQTRVGPKRAFVERVVDAACALALT